MPRQFFQKYKNKYLISWSMGVMISSIFGLKLGKLDKKIAINGTIKPIDDNYGILKIMPIKLYHDVPNCGYRVFISNKKIIYMTDTKTLEGITAKNYDLYLVEGNYENKEELHSRAVNEIYESRVINTHLSKEYTSEWLMNNMGNNSEYVFMHEHKERNKNEIRTGKDR